MSSQLQDLVLLDGATEEKVVAVLKARYQKNQIYTNIGPVLISVNPFQWIPEAYTDARIREYKGKSYFEAEPHVYALADDTYRRMCNFNDNQCIIITGESGSGKTEGSKLIMQYISAVSGKAKQVETVKKKFLDANPILEAYGNAKTVNNNNSSRFGKYMEILFDDRGDPVGGRVTNYLLEKSRVVGPGKGERNFHVFYQMLSHCSAQEKSQLHLGSPQEYAYLNCSGTYDGGIDDGKEYKERMAGLQTLGFSNAECGDMNRVTAAVLWLGNITFSEDHAERSSVTNANALNTVAQLLGVDAAALQKALITRRIQTGTGDKREVFIKPQTKANAEFTRDTLSKALYSKLFDWIVRKVARALANEEHHGTYIGILDIYGFEIFEYNSFEQLCINYVNERLQQVFIELTIKQEQEEYSRENIPWKQIPYFNNKPCCELIEGKPGVLSICDDCCHTSKTDEMFVGDLGTFFGAHQYFRGGVSEFTISHYAGEVRYHCKNFLSKNKDTLFDELVLVMQQSSHGFVRDHGWSDIEVVTDGQKKQPPTVGKIFKTQVTKLMAALTACTPHYIRCIKPNHSKKPNDFEDKYTQHQVKYLGLLENIRVRRAGYADRVEFVRFFERYKILDREIMEGKVRGDARVLSDHIVKSLGWKEGTEYALGQSKLFIRTAESAFQLEHKHERMVNSSAFMIQKNFREYKMRRYFMEKRADAHDLLKGRKMRRQNSVERRFKGDYLNFQYNPLIRNMLGQGERVAFSDRALEVKLEEKKGMLGKLFKKKDKHPLLPRLIMLTSEALYCLTFELDPSGNTAVNTIFRSALSNVQSVTMSPYADSCCIVHLRDDTKDPLWLCRKKTEFVALLHFHVKSKTGSDMTVSTQDTDTVQWLGGKKRNKQHKVNVRWERGQEVSESQGQHISPAKKELLIEACTGISGAQVTPPVRPRAIDYKAPVRAQIRAIADYQGNGVDELTLKKGDVLLVNVMEKDGWYEAELHGKKGFVPSRYVELVSKAQDVSAAKKAAMARNQQKNKILTGSGVQTAPGFVPEELPVGDWSEQKADQGQMYFFNKRTGQSQWEKPQEMKDEEKRVAEVAERNKKNEEAAMQVAKAKREEKTATHSAPKKKGYTGKKWAVDSNGGASGGAAAFAVAGSQPMGMMMPGSKGPPKKTVQPATSSTPAPVSTGGTTKKPNVAAMGGFNLMQMGGGGGVQLRKTGGAGAGVPGRAPVKPKPTPSAAAPQKPKDNAPWQKVKDESSGDFYFFNTDSGASRWDPPPGWQE